MQGHKPAIFTKVTRGVLGVLCLLAVLQGIAALFASYSDALVAHSVPDKETQGHHKARQALAWARLVNPFHPDYQTRQLTLSYSPHLRREGPHFTASEQLRGYEQLVRARPSDGAAWANIAAQKAALNEFDARFEQSFIQAGKRARHSSAVQRLWLQTGLHGWNHLSKTARGQLIEYIEAGLKHELDFIAPLIHRSPRTVLVCTYLTMQGRQRLGCSDRQLGR